ncbi:hypothetical protein H2200_004604 [Cladophialophora chaetospira]|uniref:F-box domain-containing protein n=1 Tax=Cladophialophora chaetospira TaxID=386627 RepID=A0AA39CKB9_9EURO|nr:hypothetical protein H2200_004604 [Cladophialophora chaetospira]
MSQSDEKPTLLSLPDELLEAIGEMLCEHDRFRPYEILNLRATCKRFFRVLEHTLFSCVHVDQNLDCVDRRQRQRLDGHAIRHSYVRNLMIMYEYYPTRPNIQHVRKNPTAPTSLASFLNLQKLGVVMNDLFGATPESRSFLVSQLERAVFGKLRECSLNVTSKSEACVLRLERIFRAPVLCKLSVEGADLRGLNVNEIPRHSMVLRKLGFFSCMMDKMTLSAILEKPRALESFHFNVRRYSGQSLSLKDVSHLDELVLVQQVIDLLAHKQPHLKIIWLDVRPSDLSDGLARSLDFTLLQDLKNIVVQLASRIGPRAWLPFNPFRKLPNVECIKFKTLDGLELQTLAQAVLTSGISSTNLPASLQHLIFYAYDPYVRPFTFEAFSHHEQHLQGIKTFVNQLRVSRITYTQEMWPAERTLVAVQDQAAKDGYVLQETMGPDIASALGIDTGPPRSETPVLA